MLLLQHRAEQFAIETEAAGPDLFRVSLFFSSEKPLTSALEALFSGVEARRALPDSAPL
jgi:hypothetical protein